MWKILSTNGLKNILQRLFSSLTCNYILNINSLSNWRITHTNVTVRLEQFVLYDNELCRQKFKAGYKVGLIVEPAVNFAQCFPIKCPRPLPDSLLGLVTWGEVLSTRGPEFFMLMLAEHVAPQVVGKKSKLCNNCFSAAVGSRDP